MLDTRQTNRRFYSEWYTCERCGMDYPRQSLVVHNGVIVCQGPNTIGCRDKPGFQAAMNRQDVGYEADPQALPSVSEDM